jgi:hypothetical protein
MSATDAAAAFPYAVHLDIKFGALDRSLNLNGQVGPFCFALSRE